MKPSRMIPLYPATFLFLVGLLINFLSSCSSEQGAAASAESDTPQALIASDFFSVEAINALNEIKTVFDKGVSKGYGDRSPAYVYEQHAIRMRMDYFDDTPYTSVFPYNGKFDLSGLTESVSKLPFVSDKCGFQNPETTEVINHYCFNTNPDFMRYLTVIGEKSGLIKNFQERFQEIKSIDQGMRHAMLTQSIENIDFSSQDQQYFYMLFHILVNEERLALDKIQPQ